MSREKISISFGDGFFHVKHVFVGSIVLYFWTIHNLLKGDKSVQLEIYGWKICTLYFWKSSFVFPEEEGEDDKWECFKVLKSAPAIVLSFYHEN